MITGIETIIFMNITNILSYSVIIIIMIIIIVIIYY